MAPTSPPELMLADSSRVGVIGGGPAGSFFAYFLLEMAEAVGVHLEVDIYEPRDFALSGPGGCNMCGGVVSESLVQALAAEGIQLPPSVVQRGIDSYFLHMDVGDVRIETPRHEKRIAAVYRGGGPRATPMSDTQRQGLDGHLLKLAVGRGARLVRSRVESVEWLHGRPRTRAQNGVQQTYDLLVPAVGINSVALKMLSSACLQYHPPKASKTYICEFCFGRDVIKRDLGDSMHVFLLNIPRLEFAALIPKGEFATLCLLGEDIDKALVQDFLHSPVVQQVLPPDWQVPDTFCHCSPKINIGSAVRPFADRVVFVGDCATTRLYKDGIGAAYRTAKAAAKTAIFEGVSAEAFRLHYEPICHRIRRDNFLGKVVFSVTKLVQGWKRSRRGLLRMLFEEQREGSNRHDMSTVLWDTFTGSAPYGSVLGRTVWPSFWGRFLWDIVRANGHRS